MCQPKTRSESVENCVTQQRANHRARLLWQWRTLLTRVIRTVDRTPKPDDPRVNPRTTALPKFHAARSGRCSASADPQRGPRHDVRFGMQHSGRSRTSGSGPAYLAPAPPLAALPQTKRNSDGRLPAAAARTNLASPLRCSSADTQPTRRHYRKTERLSRQASSWIPRRAGPRTKGCLPRRTFGMQIYNHVMRQSHGVAHPSPESHSEVPYGFGVWPFVR